MQRVAFTVQREQQNLAAQAADWGNWRELWRYMHDHNHAFADISLTDNAFRTAKINYMALIAANGRFVWTDAVRGDSKRPSVIRLNGDNKLEPAWSHALEQGQLISGLIATDAGVLVASGAPILDGMGKGPPRGMVLMGRLLDGSGAATPEHSPVPGAIGHAHLEHEPRSRRTNTGDARDRPCAADGD